MSDPAILLRWRLVLGAAAEAGLGGLAGAEAEMDAALDWLYGRPEPEQDERGVRGTGGGEGHPLTAPRWLEKIHELFPRETIERLERDALDRYGLHEIVTHPEALERVVPNEALAQAILRARHLMAPDVLEKARRLVDRVLRDLREKLAREVTRAFGGARERRPVRHGRAAELDAKATIRANLKRWSPAERRLYIERPLFRARSRRETSRWQVILLVDQSGSMLGSVLHASVLAACLCGMPALKVHLVAWDTEVVDLTDRVADPLEALMAVQLGGGNDAAKALRYAHGLVEAPRRAIVVLVTDFFEGSGAPAMVQQVKWLVEAGVTALGLAALDPDARPIYDRDIARACVEAGMHVAAMTPSALAAWIAEKVR